MARTDKHLFTSESVSEGHPDKVADKVSDGILDAVMAGDPNGRVACETLVTTGLCIVAGEITTTANIDFTRIARETIGEIGYNDAAYRFDAQSCAVITAVDEQSPDIAIGVDPGGAGDQGLMFGYACDETPELMPLPIMAAHHLVRRLTDARRAGELDFLRPDGKSQVTVEYADGKPSRIDAVVVSTQHDPIDQAELRARVKETIIDTVIPAHMVDGDTKYHINPTGNFVVGGPHGDTGLTGRKIIVDTYGGAAGTAAAPSRGKTRRKWTARRVTWRATSPRTSLRPDWRRAAKCNWRTRSAWPTPYRSWSIRSAADKSASRNCQRSFAKSSP